MHRIGFRPSIMPPSHRQVAREGRRPWFCVSVTFAAVLLTFAISGICVWNVLVHEFGKKAYIIHPGDEVAMKTISDDLTDVFCDGYKMTLPHMAEAFLLPSTARVNSSLIVTSHFVLWKRMWHFMNEFYLLKDSTIQVQACRTSSGQKHSWEILVIKGEGNFLSWRDDPTSTHGVITRVAIPKEMTCDTGQDTWFQVKVNSTNMYYVIQHMKSTLPKQAGTSLPYREKQQLSSDLKVNGTLLRTRYDLQDAITVCNTTCVFDLPWGSDRDVVVRAQMEHNSHEIREHDLHNLFSKCVVRIPLWICLFGITPTIFSVGVAAIFAFFLCRKKPMMPRNPKQSSRGDTVNRATSTDQLVQTEVLPENDDSCMTIQDE